MSKKPFLFIAALLALALFAYLAFAGEEEKAEPKPKEARVSVQTATAVKKDVQAWVFAEGTARSAMREYLSFEQSGRITYIMPGLREGMLVKKGTVLARQDPRRIEADLKEAKTQASLARKTFSRFEVLLEKNSASKQEYDEAKAQAENAAASLDRLQVVKEETELRAPIDGMVAYLNIEEGYLFQPGIVRTDSEEAALNTVPIVLIDPNTFEIEVEIPDFEQNRVRVGQPVLIRKGRGGAAEPDLEKIESGEFLKGVVHSVNPAISPAARAIQVEIRTTADATELKDGMFVTVLIAVEKAEAAVAVPLEALLYRNDQAYVFVVSPENMQARLQEVELGMQGVNERVIKQGVTEGDLLVTDGRYQISEGTKVQVLEKLNRGEKGLKEAGATEAAGQRQATKRASSRVGAV